MRRKPNLDLRIAKCAHLLAVPQNTRPYSRIDSQAYSKPGVQHDDQLGVPPDDQPDIQFGVPPDIQPGAMSDSLRGRWLEVFGYSELRLELGCGKGRFTVESAKNEPDVLFAAFEKSANVLVIALERADSEGLKNVKFVGVFVDDLTRYFAPGELSRIYLNFPDPWPTNRYAKRRLTAKAYLEQYAEVLRPGGEIHLKTDNLPFFEFTLDSFRHSGYELLEISSDIHKNGPVGVMTDYELQFHSTGLPIYQCRARVSSIATFDSPRN